MSNEESFDLLVEETGQVLGLGSEGKIVKINEIDGVMKQFAGG